MIRIRVLMGIILAAVLMSGSSCSSNQSQVATFNSQFNPLVQPYTFDLPGWEFRTFFSGLKDDTINPQPQPKLTPQNVIAYFGLMAQENVLKSQIQAAAAKNPQADSADQANLENLQDQELTLEPVVEQTLASQISDTLATQGIYNPVSDRLKLTFPPVNFKLEKPLYVLVVSDRNKIDRLQSVTLKQDITLAQMGDLESSVDKLNVSSLVVEIGGLGVTYPTFVVNSGDLQWTINTAAHEWTHQYLAFKPLGFRYVLDLLGLGSNSALVTINETVANIIGNEIGGLVYQKYYAQYMTDDKNATAATTPAASDSFDFNKAMRETRLKVDSLLAQGQVDQAESYMESQRQMLVSQGYYIRKLNQAYFSFYGSYADSPTSVDPTGTKLLQLRKQSPSLRDFLNGVSHFQSPQDLDQALALWFK
jgi:hypothetical protein